MDCPDERYVDYIEFKGFTKQELDSGFLVYHYPNSNFTFPGDTLWFLPENVFAGKYDTIVSFWPDTLLHLLEWEVVINDSLATSYGISGFEFEILDCNGCLPFGSQDEYGRMTQYTINGMEFYDSEVLVVR